MTKKFMASHLDVLSQRVLKGRKFGYLSQVFLCSFIHLQKIPF